MRYKLKVYTILELGQRENQEDCIFPAKNEGSQRDRLFVLCDGMGGHEAGEVASQTVCKAMSQYVLDNYDAEGTFTREDMELSVSAAYDALDALQTEKELQQRKMGTTMTCLKLHDKGCTIAHIGDSRVYHIRPNEDGGAEVLFVTRDHSLVNDLIAIGELTEEEARQSKQKNVITRAMQPNMERRAKAEIKEIEEENIRAGDYFYMCSDGMIENMDDGNICYHFSDKIPGGADAKAENLVQATCENQDNHSAIIVHVLDVLQDETQAEQPEIDDDKKLLKDNIMVKLRKLVIRLVNSLRSP